MRLIIYILFLTFPILIFGQDFRLKRDLDGHQASVTTVSLNLKNDLLYSGDSGGNIFIWDFKKGKIKKKLKGHEGKIRSIEFNTVGSKMVSSSDDGTIKVWDAFKYKLLYTFDYPELKTDPDNTKAIFAIYTPSNRDIYFGGNSKKLYKTKRDNKKVQVVHTSENRISSAILSPNQEHLVFSTGCTIKYLNLNSESVEKEVNLCEEGEFVIQNMRFSADGSQLIVLRDDGFIMFWDCEEGKEIEDLKVTYEKGGAVFDMSGNNKYMVTANYGNLARVWFNSNAKFLIRNLAGHTAKVGTVDMSDDAKYIITGSDDKLIKVWEYYDVAKKR